MKQIILFSIIFLFSLNIMGQNDIIKVKQQRNSITVQIGTDIGGASPFPPSNIPKTFKPVPKVYPNIGVRYSINAHRLFDISAELNYKHVEMGADAIVSNMRAEIPIGNNEKLIQYFTGRATMEMAFDILEVPAYITFYITKDNKNKIMIGPYFAWHIKSEFQNNPIDGFIGQQPNTVDAIITPSSQLPSDQTNFSKYLSPFDWGISFGYEREIYKKMDIALRFNFGCKDIFSTKILPYSMNSIRGTVSFSYKLWKF